MIASQPILLLDTCAIIFLAGNVRLKAEAGRAIDRAADQKNLYVSPMSAWEIGMAVARNRINTTLSAIDYFNTFMELTGAQLCGMEPSLLIAASLLPGKLHRDPVDRILISTARFNNQTLVTSDRAILAYGNEGHVKVYEC